MSFIPAAFALCTCSAVLGCCICMQTDQLVVGADIVLSFAQNARKATTSDMEQKDHFVGYEMVCFC